MSGELDVRESLNLLYKKPRDDHLSKHKRGGRSLPTTIGYEAVSKNKRERNMISENWREEEEVCSMHHA